MKSFPLKWAATRRVYEAECCASHQFQAQNGTSFGGDLASADNTFGPLKEHLWQRRFLFLGAVL